MTNIQYRMSNIEIISTFDIRYWTLDI